MVQAARHSAAADRRCVFEVFARSLPGRRRYGVLAGVGRLLEQLPNFRFDADALDFLAAQGVVDAATCEWLSGYRFTGSIDGYAEGETYFPNSPVLVIEGTFAECTVLETLVLSV
ncbi:MAG TPA: nicotinate phosphoribosyltransferase, partial [Mycobacteriales bacterium]|nr:nicotinate phosphoribosyltransferase [Mycobacteriales bacterium]